MTAKEYFDKAYAYTGWYVSPHVKEWIYKVMEAYHKEKDNDIRNENQRIETN